MRVQFELFSGGPFKIWETMASDAAAFASTLQSSQLINISHSADNSNAVIIVWYWSKLPSEQKVFG